MPRKMSKAASDFWDASLSAGPRADDLFRTLNFYPKTLTEDNKPVKGTVYLVDGTKYKEDEYPGNVPFEDKVFFTVYKDEIYNTYTLRNKTPDELLAAQGVYEEPFTEKPEPELHGFTWLRHKLSFFFGEPEVIKQYNRQKEVTKAKKIEMINEQYGCHLPYSATLTSESVAKHYIATGSTELPRQNTGKNTIKETPKKTNTISKEARERINAKRAAKMIEQLFGEDAILYQANPVVVTALKNALLDENPDPFHKEDRADLINYVLALESDGEALKKTMQRLDEFEEKLWNRSKIHVEAKDMYVQARYPETVISVFNAGYLAYKKQKAQNIYAGDSEVEDNQYMDTKDSISLGGSQMNVK